MDPVALFALEATMNVKISYTVPFDEVPDKVDDLLVNVGRDLEKLGASLIPNRFSDSNDAIIEKLDKIAAARKQFITIDLLLEDCYTILASYNKAVADMRVPRAQEPTSDKLAVKRGSGSDPTESSSD